LKTHYDLLAIEPTASPEDVKRAFRREIARYHPDKVQHLGPEFQEIAATRAAELTEAYRVLMDVELRRSYDEALDDGGQPAPARTETKRHSPTAPEPAPVPSPTPAGPAPEGPRDRRFQQERTTSNQFLRRAVLAKIGEFVGAAGGESLTEGAFDAVYRFKGRRGVFAKAEPAVRVLVRIVPIVDAAAVEEAWGLSMRTVAPDETVCLLLLGSGLSTPKELSTAISEQRRRSRKAGPIVVPVDMRDWESLFPPDTPPVVRSLLERLRSGG
jgi:curved DNA-binding protein CbpA